MDIRDFYRECDVFVTGGTGFMGKVLIEKLLRSCPGIGKMYLLVRERKGKDVKTRIKEMIDLPLFEKLRNEKPGLAEKKLFPIEGDITEPQLGLSDVDYRMLSENVSVVFHAAATVRFDEPLREAIIKNVRGTREVVQLGKQMKRLKVFLHVSTTYCNCNRIYVDEKFYPSPVGWQDAISIAENLDPKLSEICAKKFLGNFPNTYTLAKLIAEQIIDEEKFNMPMVIFRPSIVVSSLRDPISGWIDNLNGPIALMTACGKGVTLVTLAHKNKTPDFIAVDVSIKAMILAAYQRGIHNTPLDNNLPIYNCSSVKKSIKVNEILQLAVKYFMINPYDEMLWRPRILVTSSVLLFTVLSLLQQVFPAMLIDFAMKVSGKKHSVNLTKLQRKIYLATIALSRFSTKSWIFENNNFLKLLNHIPEVNQEDFNFKFENEDVDKFFQNSVIGTQKYLFNTNPHKNLQAKKTLKKLVWMDRFLRTLFFLGILKLIAKIVTHKMSSF
ncbi:putative fatty acyl-CoA reductase CG5065 [Adelges cooleyi]|uniref:putative fatty acyl-CoA reductase CG5065 n=1 Tax=Adelges cooleyi TaxID=133065 RepID=UPI00217F585D|nr:putative fatty acyl-CoA reductase CG5065 [Adelges cooleyi]